MIVLSSLLVGSSLISSCVSYREILRRDGDYYLRKVISKNQYKYMNLYILNIYITSKERSEIADN